MKVRDTWKAWSDAEREVRTQPVAAALRDADGSGLAGLVRKLAAGAGAFVDAVFEASDEGIPPNWSEFTIPDIKYLVGLMQRTGWCLTVAPSPTVLRQLIATDSSLQADVLMAAEPEILHTLDRALHSLTDRSDNQLRTFIDGARASLEAHRSGAYQSSQALSACILASLCEPGGPWGDEKRKAVTDFLADLDPSDTNLSDLRFRAVSVAVARAFATYPPTGPTPTSFNRHACVHSFGEIQYSQVNSLMGFMLVVGFLVEVSWFSCRVARSASAAQGRASSDRGPE